ncbi:MAG: Crp/Fnr family transcriptional regulator [Bacteroidetes bacterium]|nr:MAG: Crp/Fnr family transcriptional regulator [Bacteroidota bacterium]TNE98954.1 MAG: Crp/Fnr family transcriptional regulator [Bacteroidota bacterium]
MLEKSHKHVTCATCGAKKDSLFGSFCGAETSNLDEHKTCNYYKKNQPLFIEGSLPRGVFCINEGKVKIFTRGEEGKEQIIHIAKQGEIVGFRAMFSGEAYKVAATTLEECNICFINKTDFLDMVDTNQVLRNGIMRELSKELADRATFITNMAQKSVRERLAFALAMLDDIYEGEMINLTREDMANFVGTATETLIRLLKDFKDDNLIETHARKIEILDKKGLLDLAGL